MVRFLHQGRNQQQPVFCDQPYMLFAVRFGKYTPMRVRDKDVRILVNGELDIHPLTVLQQLPVCTSTASACSDGLALVPCY